MFLNDLLDVHNSCLSKDSHPDILGDGFLIKSNPIYRSIRSRSQKIGCQYVEAYSDYLLMPFQELPVLLKQKKIPYVPAARLIKKVEIENAGVFTSSDITIPESYHLHESAHLIADDLFKKLKVKSKQEKILKILLSESFANTVDALVSTFAKDETHLFFIKQNSYMHPQIKVIQAMNELSHEMGFRFTFMLTFFTYLRANFLVSPLNKKLIQEITKRYSNIDQFDAKHNKCIKTVCGIGEKLDPLFRYKTTSNYFKQQGFEEDIEELLNFPFMKVFEARSEFKEVVESMCDVLFPVN
jgi:hypothetical protein